MRRIARHWLALLGLGITLGGCGAGWHRVELVPGPLRAGQQAQLWHGPGVEQWHAVVVTADSVSGVPFLQPSACDSCRRSYPRAAVDSLRLGDPVGGFWATAALVVVAPLVAIEIECTVSGHAPFCWPTRD